MSSRNATRQDFDHVIHQIQSGRINPSHYITHTVPMIDVINHFPTWLDPKNGVIKAMVMM